MNLVESGISTDVMPMVVSLTLSMVGSGQHSIVSATKGSNVSVAENPVEGHLELVKEGNTVAW